MRLPWGKLVFHIFGALAEFERDIIRERTLAGLEAARRRTSTWPGPGSGVGRSLGRSPSKD